MKAILIEDPGPVETLTITETSDPDPAPDELLVDVKACALNRADLLQRKGLYPAPANVRDDIPGLEYAGVVRETTSTDSDFTAGDRVFGIVPGAAQAERVTPKAGHAIRIPESLSFEEAAAVPEVFITAYDALIRQGNCGLGDRVLIHAAGSGLGTAALQIAHQAGASPIFGTASAAKLRQIGERELPLDVPINYESKSFREVVESETGGQGIDLILDVVGGPYWEDNLDCLRSEGTMILLGLLGGDEVTADLKTLLLQRARVIGSTLRMRSDEEKTDVVSRFKRDMLGLLEVGRLSPVIDRILPWTDVRQAHRTMENNENTGKIVLSLD